MEVHRRPRRSTDFRCLLANEWRTRPPHLLATELTHPTRCGSRACERSRGRLARARDRGGRLGRPPRIHLFAPTRRSTGPFPSRTSRRHTRDEDLLREAVASGNAVADKDRVDRIGRARLPVVVTDEVIVRGVERRRGHLLVREAVRTVPRKA